MSGSEISRYPFIEKECGAYEIHHQDHRDCRLGSCPLLRPRCLRRWPVRLFRQFHFKQQLSFKRENGPSGTGREQGRRLLHVQGRDARRLRANGNSSPLNIVEFRNIENPDKIVDIEIDEGSAQEQFDKAAAKDKYTAGGDVKLGNYTWKTLNFTWNKQPSVVLYTDITEGLYAEVTLYETTLEDAAVNAFLEGVEFATDYDAAHKAGMDTTVEKFTADNNLKLWEAK